MAETIDMAETIRIGFLLVPEFPLMAYSAAIEPLRAANRISGRLLYSWWNASPDGTPVAASNGICVLPDADIGPHLAADRVFVCAGGNPSTFADRGTLNWLRRLSRRGVTIGGISGGPYVVARAGLLDGHRCTIHWEHAPAFKETFPKIELARSLFEIDDKRITCSGGIAALDMMLHLVSQDHGQRLAADIGEWFLHDEIRTGVAPQRMRLQQRFGVSDARLVRVLEKIESNLEVPLSRSRLAAIGGLSLRQLQRLFRTELGTSLHRHYLHQRLAQARRLERESALSAAEIATATGFSSASELRRASRASEARRKLDSQVSATAATA